MIATSIQDLTRPSLITSTLDILGNEITFLKSKYVSLKSQCPVNKFLFFFKSITTSNKWANHIFVFSFMHGLNNPKWWCVASILAFYPIKFRKSQFLN